MSTVSGVIASQGKSIVRDANLLLRLEAGLIQSYSGSGTTWTDISGNAKNATLVASPTFTNTYFTFASASSQYANFASSIAATTQTTGTICLWVYPTGQGQLLAILGQSTINTSYHHCAMDISSAGVFGFGLWNGTSVSKVSSAAQSLNRWHHICITYASSTLIGYVNSVSIGSPASFTWSAPVNSLFFGLMALDSTICNVAASYGNGRIGHFSYYNRALSATEIAQNYNAGLGMYGA